MNYVTLLIISVLLVVNSIFNYTRVLALPTSSICLFVKISVVILGHFSDDFQTLFKYTF